MNLLTEEEYATLSNTPGMGDVTLPQVPSDQYGFSDAEPGSGDIPKNYIILSMQDYFNWLNTYPNDSNEE